MANVKITEKDGRVIEVSDISFDEIRQLVTPNGNGHARTSRTFNLGATNKRQPDYRAFKASLSDNSRKFFKVLHENPNGLSNEHLAEKLGFASTNQIGGVTGGGIGKRANQYNVNVNDLWNVEVTRENGERRVIYKPGPEIEKVL
jgi:hypothetical protein